LSFVFCSDAYLLEINKQYLNHDTFTDIVTFDSSEDEDVIAGDIFISVERIRENASKFSVSEKDELNRVIIHGVLHLCGYYDKKKEDKALMTEKEDYYLSTRAF
jgi:rRNA maturation RNase YbeY